MLMDQIQTLKAHVYIGFECHCLMVAKMLSAINLPLISHVSYYYVIARIISQIFEGGFLLTKI